MTSSQISLPNIRFFSLFWHNFFGTIFLVHLIFMHQLVNLLNCFSRLSTLSDSNLQFQICEASVLLYCIINTTHWLIISSSVCNLPHLLLPSNCCRDNPANRFLLRTKTKKYFKMTNWQHD